VDDNRCPRCGYKVHIFGKPPAKKVSASRRFIPVKF